MKQWKKYYPLSLMMIIIMGSCSPKLSNQKIDTLEGQEALLKKSTDLNDLKLDLEKNRLKQAGLAKDVEEINRSASASANDAKENSSKVSRNPGEAGIANRANSASKQAASDAKKAKKLNQQLQDVNREIKGLEEDIIKKEKELSELKARVEFVPNT